LAAEVTPANLADNEQAPALIEVLPAGLRFLLGDQHYHDPALSQLCDSQGCTLVTSFTGKNNPYPHHDDGVAVRKILHKIRSIAIENFNEHFKAIFDVHGAVPTKGLVATRRFVLSAVFVYQLAVLYLFLAEPGPAHRLQSSAQGRLIFMSRPQLVENQFEPIDIWINNAMA
jgi:hypothetical protein